MSDTNKLTASVRTEFGKGAARRTRRDGLVPVVLYGHGTEPQHLTVVARDFATILRKDGTNAVLSLDIDGKEQLALTKQVVVHPLRNYIEHTDLLVIKKGEKVTVSVPVIVEGDPAGGTQVAQDLNEVEIEADALSIPENIVVNVHNLEVGTQIAAGQLEVPAGVTVLTDPEALIVNITEIAAAETEGDDATEGDEPAAEAAE
ncbi:Large ribosomal subunit protein bL25 OS=Tsukamurella paurometabola (strain ATCC 8368 / DSM /CCUG 35730 / CIP 100753 / JCM 10117 / KCTC 9821 / NBRC 16120/ NCIMB 702349 / NCTC 13040) OX=521096 GN=rplY PE=3 SV=1 [Tsukamurella paurometabola]|uniref:Large ribosomal subunit protein bL25 n=1 Tax=Tsukamurella paurometabola (strain ATCC 8368 / DSM 20162 / CCUG 35730 / CIP 100753 / JCM 10117 / KCTC 9821 / NBRC 16120 / NCIMB 702349 / NCTC 13040) TaxID=521096 RepID=D5UVL4_TSUPD|nr:50S ribosomal protein L25/general stress protein Ctc [Tsukamurella paurometabola]ADG79796.1 ribosomal 5S rRNA E-loop binding protein Ctc/L25/TL5 [Tsukamurella paurometabola DSM 20162]SUP37262.1 General stress protein CTC [Tsukamurella paurometabola]